MILEKMQEINSFLEKKMWVDFCFEKISDNYLKLVGSNDFSCHLIIYSHIIN